MENKKKIIVFVIVLVIIVVVAIVLFGLNKKKDNENNSEEKMSQVVNDDTFFSVQSAIKQYYDILANNDGETLIKILDEDYKKSKNISKDTVDKVFEDEYVTPFYTATSIYHNKIGNVTYYFINGFLIDISVDGHPLHNLDNVNFLVVVDEESLNYIIRPLEDVKDLKKYANDYNLKEVSIKNDVKFTKLEMDIKRKLEIYLHTYLYVLIYKPQKAYDMIYDELKDRYKSYEEFDADFEKNCSVFQNQIVSYKFKEESNARTYNIKDSKSNKIKIYEVSPNNFKVSFSEVTTNSTDANN